MPSETKGYPRKFVEACHSKFNINSIESKKIRLCYLNIIKRKYVIQSGSFNLEGEAPLYEN